MDCQFCGTENPENAVFCKSCGKRIDGFTVCPACNELSPADGTYCTNCGARLDGKIVCKTCGSVFEGNFCPDCGAAAQTKTKKERAKQDIAESDAAWQKILWHVGAGFGLLTAICSLIFVFLIGCTAGDVDLISGIGGKLGLKNSVNLYYYFGEAYEEIGENIDSIGYCPDIVVISAYCGAVVRTLIAAGAIISVVVFSVLTIVRFATSYANKTRKKIGSTAFAAFLSYVAGATLFLASNAAEIKAKASSVTVTVATGYDAATIAGISLCAVFAAIGILCFIARRGKELLTKQNVINLSFTVAALALLSVVIAVSASPSLALNLKSGTATTSIFVGLLPLSELIPSVSPLATDAELPFAYSFVSFIMLIAVVVLTIVILVRMISDAADDKSRAKLSTLPTAIALCAAGVLFLTFAVLGGDMFIEIYNISTGLTNAMTVSYTGAIVIFVFAALNLFTSIARTITKHCIKKSS